MVKGDDSIRESLKEFARDDWEGEDDEKKKDLEEVVKWAKPTVMIGTSTNPGAFNVRIHSADDGASTDFRYGVWVFLIRKKSSKRWPRTPTGRSSSLFLTLPSSVNASRKTPTIGRTGKRYLPRVLLSIRWSSLMDQSTVRIFCSVLFNPLFDSFILSSFY